jgi:putative addiction module component (TIGR02574 family)
MIAESIPQLSALSADEKILLAAELWHEAVGESGEPPSPALMTALRERLDYYREHPTEVSTWEEVRARILGGQASPNA